MTPRHAWAIVAVRASAACALAGCSEPSVADFAGRWSLDKVSNGTISMSVTPEGRAVVVVDRKDRNQGNGVYGGFFQQDPVGDFVLVACGATGGLSALDSCGASAECAASGRCEGGSCLASCDDPSPLCNSCAFESNSIECAYTNDSKALFTCKSWTKIGDWP